MAHLLICALLVSWGCVAQAAEFANGHLSDVRGDVEVQKRGGWEWIRAFESMTIGPGDQISTGLNSRAALTIKDSRTDISPLTQVVVGRSVQAGDQAYTELFLRMGKVVSRVKKTANNANRFNIVTPVAIIGVHGTQEAVSHFPGIGTQAVISDGKGYAAPTPNRLAAPVRGILGIAASAKSKSKSTRADASEKKAAKDVDDKNKKEKKKKSGEPDDEGEETDKNRLREEGEALILAFNSWLDQFDMGMTPEAAISDLGVLDYKTLENAVPVDDGLRVTVGDRTDPGSLANTSETRQEDAQSDMSPAGLSESEQEEMQSSNEESSLPGNMGISEDQSSFEDASNEATATSTFQQGVPPAAAGGAPPSFPNRAPEK